MFSLVFFYVSFIYITTDYDCNCLHEKMPGLCSGVHESYAHFTICTLIWGRNQSNKKFKRYLESNLFILGSKDSVKGSLLFHSAHVTETDHCDSEKVTSYQAFF